MRASGVKRGTSAFVSGLQVAGAAAMGYGGILSLLYLFQRQIIFPGAGVGTSLAPTRTGGQLLRAADGSVGLFFPPQPGKRTVVFLHGNGDQLAWGPAELGAKMNARGLGFLGIEYPGFGAATGTGAPSETSINAAANSVIEHVMQQGQVPAGKLLIMGQSIGCAPALKLCKQWTAAPAALVSPFTSVGEMAIDSYPLLRPAQSVGLLRWLIHDQFDNLQTAATLENNVLVLHGRLDEIVPFRHGVAVSNALGHARFVAIEGAHHNDMLSRGDVMDEIIDFALQ